VFNAFIATDVLLFYVVYWGQLCRSILMMCFFHALLDPREKDGAKGG
jgi:NADH:ubiquinone oxidoreductase subunit 4 (subunit M)